MNLKMKMKSDKSHKQSSIPARPKEIRIKRHENLLTTFAKLTLKTSHVDDDHHYGKNNVCVLEFKLTSNEKNSSSSSFVLMRLMMMQNRYFGLFYCRRIQFTHTHININAIYNSSRMHKQKALFNRIMPRSGKSICIFCVEHERSEGTHKKESL